MFENYEIQLITKTIIRVDSIAPDHIETYCTHEDEGALEVRIFDTEKGYQLVKSQVFNEPIKENNELYNVVSKIISKYESVAALLKKYGYEPEDYTTINVPVYRDRMNDGYYEIQNEDILIPSYTAEHIKSVKVNFTMDNIRFLDNDDKELFSTVSVGYDDLVTPTAFLLD